MVEINWSIENLTPKQKRIADFLQKNIESVLYMTETELAEQLQVSNATVSRFWKSIGYENFRQFKKQLKERMEITPANKLENMMNQAEPHDMPDELLAMSMHHLQETVRHSSSEPFKMAVEALAAANTIYVYSPGPSGGLAQLLQFRLARFGLKVHIFSKSGHELFESLVHLEKDDVVLLFGFVRLHPETCVILNHAKDIQCPSIVITDRLVSDFHTYADITLYASRGELAEFHSMVAPTFLIENLIIGIGIYQKEKSLAKLKELNQLRKKYKDMLPR